MLPALELNTSNCALQLWSDLKMIEWRTTRLHNNTCLLVWSPFILEAFEWCGPQLQAIIFDSFLRVLYRNACILLSSAIKSGHILWNIGIDDLWPREIYSFNSIMINNLASYQPKLQNGRFCGPRIPHCAKVLNNLSASWFLHYSTLLPVSSSQ